MKNGCSKRRVCEVFATTTLILGTILTPAGVFGCVLCPLHIPARPRPLNQFRLPSIQKILDTADAIHYLCENRTIVESALNVASGKCQSEVVHLSCSLKELIANLKSECPGPEDSQQCAKCRADSAKVYKQNQWVLTWIDAIGKMPSGISDGNYHWLGDYEQCLWLKNEKNFNGQYCLLQFKVPDTILNIECEHSEPLEVYLGICLPASCSPSETKQVVEYVANHDINVHCGPPISWSLSSKIFLAFTLLWALMVVSVSLFVWIFDTCNEDENKWLAAVCLQRNVRESLRTRRLSTATVEFSTIPGIQVVSTILLIFGNLFFLIMPYLENVAYFYGVIESFIAQPIVNYSLYIDGLFALSGFRLSLKLLSDDAHEKFCPLVWKHFIWFWPSYCYITLFMALLYVRLGEGPIWSLSDISERCASSFLVNILFINNLFGHSKTCLDAGFVYALEAQFFVVLLTLLMAFRYFKRHQRLIMLLFPCSPIFGSIVCTYIISFVYRTAPTLIPTNSDLISSGEGNEKYSVFIDWLYLNPLTRAPPFLVGALGALYVKRLMAGGNNFRAGTTTFQPLVPFFGLLCLPLLVCPLIWSPYLLALRIFNEMNDVFSALYCAIHRTIWALVVIYLCVALNGSKNGLSKFLSWRVFTPLSKLVYIVLLISQPVSLSLFSSLHRPIYITLLSTITTGLGTLCCTFLIAFLIDVMISRPIRRITNNFFHSSSCTREDRVDEKIT